MSPALSACLLRVTLTGVVLLGRSMRRRLPEHHLSADSKDVVQFKPSL